MKVRGGRLEVITGPMFSGKTEELIRRIQRLNVAGYKVQVFHPDIDNRYSEHSINSHNGASVESFGLKGVRELLENIDENSDCYAFDEVQFLEANVIDIINKLRKNGKIVLVAGLNQDFTGKPFKFKNSERHMGELIAMADNIIYVTAVCTHIGDNGICEGIATKTQRFVNGKPAKLNDPLVVVGGKDKYEARCVKHHFVEDE